MKRAVKITLISLASTLAALLVIVVAVACVLMHVVFTPAKLTPVVQKVAAEYITCEHEIGEVDLTFFSTFPEFGLRAKGLLLVNPMEGAQSDTLLSAPEVVAMVDVVAFLRQETLRLREVRLTDAVANLYINAEGASNLDVFALPEDTVAEEDTTAFSLPFREIEVGGLALNSPCLTFVDEKDSIEAALVQTVLTAEVGSWEDVVLDLRSAGVTARVGETRYADSLGVALHVPAAVDLEQMHFVLRKAELQVNRLSAELDGAITLQDTIDMDVRLCAHQWPVKDVLALIPNTYADMLSDIELEGLLSLDATVRGQYADSLMPLVDAHLALEDGEGAYRPLPYRLRDLALEADAHIDLLDSPASTVTIRSLSAKTKESQLAATGTVSDVLSDMLLDLQLKLDVNLPDADYFLPDSMLLEGRAKGSAAARIRLSDLSNMRLEKGTVSGDLQLTKIHYLQDSMEARLPRTQLAFRIPNPRPSHKKTAWLQATADLDGLDFSMDADLQAKLQKAVLQVESGNILSDDPVLYAALDLQSEKPFEASMDSMGGVIKAPRLKAYAEYNTKDTTVMPVLEADLQFADLRGHYSDIDAHLTRSRLEASLSGGRKDKSAPRLKANLTTEALQASMTDLRAKTNHLHLEASARYNKAGENLLLQWNPRLVVQLQGGEANMAALSLPVYVPSIDFAYSNKKCEIRDSRIQLGNSDFSLRGEVENIGRWFRHEGELTGSLDFISDYTDLNELMALFSAEEGSEESAETASASTASVATEVDTTANPFMVPLQVDMTLNTRINQAVIWDESLHNLGGRVYVKDGVLVLEQMGFVCNAAKLQLTAIYRTPRRNHIYVGFDYHMLDVDIRELIHMIPQLDTLLPMLHSFAGNAEFHLAAETYTNAYYEPKYSTLRGAASIFGRDLTVLDNETFSTISKLLTFKKRTENKIDSVSAELTVYKKEIDVYPFCVNWDKYMVALGGRHNLDMTFDYDVNVLSPIYLGVNVSGNLDDLKIKLAKCKYAQDFRPILHRDVDKQSAELRSMIRESMRKNVKIQ